MLITITCDHCGTYMKYLYQGGLRIFFLLLEHS